MVSIKNLSFGYNRQPLFHDLSLRLEPGNIHGLLGLNGAGKSTLLKLMAGLLFARSGELRALDRDPARRDPDFLGRTFLLPENLYLPGITDQEFERALAPFYPGFDPDRLRYCIDAFEVPRGQILTKLSHGQQKKFLLAFGFASGAELLLLDEPTNGLDIPSKGLFRRLVAETLSERRTFVISTHQVRDVAQLVDRIVIVHQGKVLLHQSISSIGECLRIEHGATEPPANAEGLIYSESGVGGQTTLWRNAAATDGPVDLEVLFNAVIARPDLCRDLFKGGDS
jgi:ABC-2 type transport system ATP-binding protein